MAASNKTCLAVVMVLCWVGCKTPPPSTVDAPSDAATLDSGTWDAGAADSAVTDASRDSGAGDAAVVDAAFPDAAVMDAGVVSTGLDLAGWRVDETAALLTLDLGNGVDVLGGAQHPFALLLQRGSTLESAAVDTLSVVSVGAGRAQWRLGSTTAPGFFVTVDAVLGVHAQARSLLLTVAGAEVPPSTDNATLVGLSTRISVPLSLECQVGTPLYVSVHHSCSGVPGTLAVFCEEGDCENTVHHAQDPSLASSTLGAELTGNTTAMLVGASAVFLGSPHPVGTVPFLQDLVAFRDAHGRRTPMLSSLFFTAPPSDGSGVPPQRWTAARAQTAAAQAVALGFGEVLLLDATWLLSYGAFDAAPALNDVVAAFTSQGLTPVLHTLASLLQSRNPLCVPAQPPLLDACPSGAWRVTPAGVPIIPPGGGAGDYLWDINRADVASDVVNSHAVGVQASGAGGVYADAADFFMTNQESARYLRMMAHALPGGVLRASVGPSNSALYVADMDMTDTWQVLLSRTPADWVFNLAHPMMRGWWSHLPNAPRMGWIPPPRPSDGPLDYLPLLQVAVANGAPITLEADAQAPAFSMGSLAWFPPALRLATDAIAEIRAGDSLGTPAFQDARHEVMHFSNGVSTVALFDEPVPGAHGAVLEARGHGVVVEQGAAACGVFASCYRFDGGKRLPASYLEPALTSGGHWMLIPGATETRTGSLTMAAWFKLDDAPGASTTGTLLQKSTFGYGLTTYEDGAGVRHVGGNMGGAQSGSFPVNAYTPVTADAWHHVVWTYEDSIRQVTLFLDGAVAVQGTPQRGPAITYAETPLWIGASDSPQSNFTGWLNDVRVYNRALTGPETTALFQRTVDPRLEQGLVVAVDAEEPVTSAPVVVRVALGMQHTAWLVPVLHGAQLPPERVRLTFTGFNPGAPPQVVTSAAVAFSGFEDDLTFAVELDAVLLGAQAVRVRVQ